MKKIALITGITGQDGSYLAHFLLKKNYIVHGIKRRSSTVNNYRIDWIYSNYFQKLKKPKWNGVPKVQPERNPASEEAVRGLINQKKQNGTAFQKCSRKGIQLPGRRFGGLKIKKKTKKGKKNMKEICMILWKN